MRQVGRFESIVPGVLELLVPRHLNGFEPAFVGFLRIVGEAFQLGHVAVQIGESHRERINLRKLLLQADADLFGVGPVNLTGHGISFLRGRGRRFFRPPRRETKTTGYLFSASVRGLPSET